MKDLIIIGAGGAGREILGTALDNPCCNHDWRIKGFLDNRPNILDAYAKHGSDVEHPIDFSEEKHERYRRDYPVLGDPLTYVPQEADVFLCALGNPADRKKYVEPLVERGAQFIRLVHPLALVASTASIGPGSIIGAYVSLSPDCRIGQHVSVSIFSVIGHDTQIDDWTEVGAHCTIGGNVSIGAAARVYPASTLLPKVNIGERAVVAAGSVVFKNVKAGTTVLGNPARRFDWKP